MAFGDRALRCWSAPASCRGARMQEAFSWCCLPELVLLQGRALPQAVSSWGLWKAEQLFLDLESNWGTTLIIGYRTSVVVMGRDTSGEGREEEGERPCCQSTRVVDHQDCCDYLYLK